MMAAVNRALFWSFCFFVYFVHYQTTLAFGTLHSYVLIAGVVIVLPQIAVRCIRSGYRLPRDYMIASVLLLSMFVGFFVNIRDAQLFTLKAYLLGVACYVFLRAVTPAVRLEHFFALNAVFIVGNSVLMLAQLATGEYFPARFLAAGNPPLILTSGFADGPTKNGMIHASALSLILARALFLRAPLMSMNGLALLLGTGTLLLTTSRAGIVAFAAAVLFNVGLLGVWRGKLAFAPRRVIRGLAVVVVAGGALFYGARYAMSDRAQTAGRAATVAGQYASGILALKFMPKDGDLTSLIADDSVGQRFTIYRTVLVMLSQHPQIVVFGTGIGSFEALFDEYTTDRSLVGAGGSTHNSWLEFLVEGGVLTYLVWLVLTVHVVRKALGRPDAALAVPILSALISTMVFMVFHDVLRGRMFWLPLGILGAMAYYRGPLDSMGAHVASQRPG